MKRPDNIIDIISAYDHLINEINSNIQTIRAYPKILTGKDDKAYHLIFDRCLFIALVQNDLLISLKYLDLSNTIGNAYEANHFARTTALHCYETLNHLNKSIGKDLQTFFAAPPYKNVLTRVNQVGRKLNGIKKIHFKKLESLRNNVIGHKSANGLEQTELMLGVNNKELYDLGTEVYKANFELIGAYMEILKTI